MISFKQFLLEKPMNDKTFSDVKKRLGTTAKVGFEFEMIIPIDSSVFANAENDNRGTQVISHYDSLDEFTEFFDIYKSDLRAIDRDMNTWLDEQRENWVDENWEEYTDEDTSEAEARKLAEDDYPGVGDEFSEWIRAAFNLRIDFVNEYGLQPKYGWWYQDSGRYASIYTEEADDDNTAGSSHTMRQSLDAILDEPILVNDSYHSSKKDLTSWYIEPDGSIDAGSGHGLELVSPPFTLDKGIKIIDTIFNWMDSVGARTNESTGLHINISVPDIKTRLDPVKMVLFMGEKFATDTFNRTKNKYTNSQIAMIMGNVKSTGRLPSSAKAMSEVANDFLSQNKHFTVNFGNLANGYIECRAAGGAGYEQDAGKVKKMVYRLITAVEIACDPSSERQEYLKKLTLLFDNARDAVEDGAVDVMATAFLPKELIRLAKFDKMFPQDYKNVLDATKQDEKRHAVIVLLNVALKAVNNFKTSLDLKEKVALKKLAKSAALQSADADDFFGSNHIDRLKFKKEFAI